MEKQKKFLFIFTLLILILYLISLILVNVGLFNKIIKMMVEKNISNLLKGECRIESLRGSLNRFQFKNVYFKNKDYNFCSRKINLSLSLFSILFKKIIISKIYIDEIYVEKDGKVKTADNTIKVRDQNILDLEKIKFDFLIPHLSNNFRMDINKIEISNIRVKYDDFTFKGSKSIGSFVLDKNSIFSYFKFIDFNLDTLKFDTLQMNIALEDSLIVNTSCVSKLFSIKLISVVKDSSLAVRDCKIDFKGEEFFLNKKSFLLSGNLSLNFKLTSSLEYLDLYYDFEKILYDKYSLKSVNGKIIFEDGGLKMERFECNDDNLSLSGTGYMDLKDNFNSEFNFNIQSFSLDSIFKTSKFQNNSFNGKIIVKTDFTKYFTLNLDSIKGHYGEKEIKLNGILTYREKQFLIKNFDFSISGGDISINGRMGKKVDDLRVNFNNFPISFLSEIFNRTDLGGELNGNLLVNGMLDDFKGKASLEITNFSYKNNFLSFLNFNGSFEYGKKRIKTLVGSLYGLNGNIFNKNINIFYAEFKKENENFYCDIDALSEVISLRVIVDGLFDDVNYEFKGNLNTFDFFTDVDSLSLKQKTFIDLSPEKIKIEKLSLEGKKSLVYLNLNKTKTVLEFDFKLSDKNLVLTKYFLEKDISGDALIYGEGIFTSDSKKCKIYGKGKNLNFYEIKVDSFDFHADLLNDTFQIDQFNIYNDNSLSYLFGNIFLKESITSSSLGLKVNFENIGEKYFYPLSNIFTLKTKKGLTLKGEVKGTLKDPQLFCDVYADTSLVFIKSLGTTVSDVYGHGRIEKDSIYGIILKGKSKKGNITLVGKVKKNGWKLDNYHFKISGNGIYSDGIDYVSCFADCDIDINGNLEGVLIGGNICISEGISNFPFVVDVSPTATTDQRYKTNFDLKFKSDGNLWLKNNFVDIELKGDVNFKKNESKYNITGNAEVIRGIYFYLDKKFNIEKGIFNMQQTSREIYPTVDIQAATNVSYTEGEERKDAIIRINVKGNVNNPQVSLSSEPAMSFENIVSILNFNTTLNYISNFDDLTKSIPEKALQIYLRNRYLNTISSSIGVDQLDISTDLLGNEKSAKLSIGKYIGKKFYIFYTHDIFSFSRDIFKLEYRIGKNSSFITEKDAEGNYNSGLKFILRF